MNTPRHTILPISHLVVFALRDCIVIHCNDRRDHKSEATLRRGGYEVVRLSQALRNVELGHNQLVRLDGTS